MPNKARDLTSDIADTLSRGEPGVAVVRGLRRVGDRATQLVEVGGKQLREWTTASDTPSQPNRPHPRDIELPNLSGRRDPRLPAAKPSLKDLGSKISSGYKTVRKLGGSR